MDSLDRKIVKELVRNNVMPFPSPSLRKSFRTIAKGLGVDQGTIRNRIKKLEENGLLKEFYLGVNPSLFGFKIGAVWFDVRPLSEKENLKRQIALMDKMLLVCDYLGPKLSAVFCYEREEDLSKTVRRITRMANSEDVFWQDRPFLKCDVSNLIALDWKILHSLQKGNPRKKLFSAVAKEVGVSTKTVKKRVLKLVEAGAAYLLASIDLGSFENFVPADLMVFYESPEYRDEVNAAVTSYLGEMLVFADTQDKQHGYFALATPSIAKISEIRNWVVKCRGVSNARTEILQEFLSVRRFYDDSVRNKIEVPIKVSV